MGGSHLSNRQDADELYASSEHHTRHHHIVNELMDHIYSYPAATAEVDASA